MGLTSKIEALESEIRDRTKDYGTDIKKGYVGVCSALFMARTSYNSEHVNKGIVVGCINVARKTVKRMSNGNIQYQEFHNYVLKELEEIENALEACS